jgi:glycosyltransferase involved in cell wall biosynthesis
VSKGVSLAVVILAYNEEKHIQRCIRSVQGFSAKIIVVDSFSTDRTIEIAESEGASVFQHEFINQAAQLNWALDNLSIETDWVMRLDADEIVTPSLADEIPSAIEHADVDTSGFLVNRCTYFNRQPIRHGGHYPQYVLRIWRNGQARCEASWMDEHMVLLTGSAQHLRNEIHDDNLNNIGWWTDKHNRYATREAIVLLEKKYGLITNQQESTGELKGQARVKRWLKDNVYTHLPLGWRALFFYIYRMIFRLGFLDGRTGITFHFLQGLWYRYLVDMKIAEVEARMKKDDVGCAEAIRREFSIDPFFR